MGRTGTSTHSLTYALIVPDSHPNMMLWKPSIFTAAMTVKKEMKRNQVQQVEYHCHQPHLMASIGVNVADVSVKITALRSKSVCFNDKVKIMQSEIIFITPPAQDLRQFRMTFKELCRLWGLNYVPSFCFEGTFNRTEIVAAEEILLLTRFLLLSAVLKRLRRGDIFRWRHSLFSPDNYLLLVLFIIFYKSFLWFCCCCTPSFLHSSGKKKTKNWHK